LDAEIECMTRQITLLFLLFAAVLAGCARRSGEPVAVEAVAVNEQPAIPLTLLDNSVRNVDELTGKNVLIFFQPDCDHCQREAAEIERNLEAFGNATLYFITSAPLEEVKPFADAYKLNGRPNVFFAFTPAAFVLNNYGPISAPSVYIYSEDHKLVKAFNGETPVGKILAAM
jgi:peroxiredoxin